MSTPSACPPLLLVDDCAEITVIVERLGRQAGQAIVSRPDVPAAWEYLSETCPELLILDLNLPGESGLVLCRRVRASARLAKLPIALFSHWDRSEDIAAGLDAGAEFVLSKDLLCEPAQWQERIQDLLSHLDSHPFNLSLSLNEAIDLGISAPRCAEIINRALRQPALNVLDQDILRVLISRASARAGWPGENGLLPDKRGLQPACMTRAHGQEIAAFAVALADQIWCVMGRLGSAPLAAALAAGIPRLAEILAHS